MIRKLESKDYEMVMDFLKAEPSLNLFIIGDLESFGFESDFQELWGDFDDKENIRAVLLRYYNSYIPYAKSYYDVKGFVDLIREKGDMAVLSGMSTVVEQMESYLTDRLGKKQVTYFCECTKDSFVESETDKSGVRILDLDGVDELLALRASIKEFVPNARARDMLIKGLETKTARTYYMEMDEQMVAAASTAAENSLSAMVVGVCTKEEYRKRGLASIVVEKLVKDVLAEGKIACLFYDNPEAGRIYKRIGFKDIGMWTMYR
jgi:predicted GNAT family acetyltransferase